MSECNRLVQALLRAYPTATAVTAYRSISLYRKDRDANGIDWEDQRAMFRNILKAAIKLRHKKLIN